MEMILGMVFFFSLFLGVDIARDTSDKKNQQKSKTGNPTKFGNVPVVTSNRANLFAFC